MKRLIPAGLILLIIAAWVCTVQAGYSGPKQMKQHLQAAEKYEEKELYLNAIEEYMAARQFTEDDYEIKLKVIGLYEKLGEENTCIKLCRQVIEGAPDRPEAYELLLKYYSNQESNRKLIPFIYTAKEQFPENAVFQEKFKELEKIYRISEKGFDALSEFENGMAVAERFVEITEDGKDITEEIIINESGFKAMDIGYSKIEFTDKPDEFLVRDESGSWKIVNQKGYSLANNKDVSFDTVGRISQGYGSAVTGGTYHLINSGMKVSNNTWDDIGAFHDGFTASKKGGKWALFSLDGLKETTDYTFDDVKENNFGYSYMNECFAVKKDGKYWFADKKGNLLSEEGFEDVKAFESKQPTSAMAGGKWGFAVSDGRWYLEPQYEDARPFCNGYAPVKKDGLWGYINKDNELIVEPQFQEAGNVTERGIAPVKGENGWDILRLDILYYKK